jgi:hypothetical protein
MRIACLITKVTHTHSEYVIPIAFPLLQWLHARTLMLVLRAMPVLFHTNIYYVSLKQ